ncbi:nuclear transport factor 2 family protein [Sediminibacterium sp. WSJ-3]|nr:nuclear transport factor 2 family protein [Sediminibacterium soli]
MGFCAPAGNNPGKTARLSHAADDKESLYKEIVRADSLFFDAYNNCKMAVMDSMISADIEFYHDQGGLTTNKQDILTALRNNICGKVTRELKPGSIEVYAIPNTGAVEMGMHGFHNNQEKPPPQTRFAKFVQLWRKEHGKWKLSRVISLH